MAKYNFKGIKKHNANGLKLALSAIPGLGWLGQMPVFSKLLLEWIGNNMANKGLILMNIGYIEVDGHVDQNRFDNAVDTAINKIRELGGVENLTPEQAEAIDAEFFKDAKDFIVIGKPK